MPQSQRFNQTVNAGVTTDLLQNRALQDVDSRFTNGAYMTVYASQDQTDGQLNVSIGTDTPIQPTTPNTRADSVVNQNEDMIGQFFIKPGDRIRMNATGGAATTAFRVTVSVQAA